MQPRKNNKIVNAKNIVHCIPDYLQCIKFNSRVNYSSAVKKTTPTKFPRIFFLNYGA